MERTLASIPRKENRLSALISAHHSAHPFLENISADERRLVVHPRRHGPRNQPQLRSRSPRMRDITSLRFVFVKTSGIVAISRAGRRGTGNHYPCHAYSTYYTNTLFTVPSTTPGVEFASRVRTSTIVPGGKGPIDCEGSVTGVEWPNSASPGRR